MKKRGFWIALTVLLLLAVSQVGASIWDEMKFENKVFTSFKDRSNFYSARSYEQNNLWAVNRTFAYENFKFTAFEM